MAVQAVKEIQNPNSTFLLEDDLMKRFGSERIKAFMERMNLTEEESVIKSGMLTRQVEGAQKRVEGNNYDSRKQILQYDDVMREQRNHLQPASGCHHFRP